MHVLPHRTAHNRKLLQVIKADNMKPNCFYLYTVTNTQNY